MSLLTHVSIEDVQSISNSFIDKDQRKYLIILGTINGYHYFQIRPLMGIEFPLTCVREPENSFDNNAFKVMAPRVREVSLDVLDLTVRPNPIQTVRKICGKPVGRMPASLAKLISNLKDQGDIGDIKAIYTGDMQHGQHFILGNGPKLICVYFIKVFRNSVYEEIGNKLVRECNALVIDDMYYL